MKTREEQIAEMAKAMSDFEMEDAAKCDIELAEHLLAKGYRKQSDTIREFVDRIAEFASTMRLLANKEYEDSRLVKAMCAQGKLDAVRYMMKEIKNIAEEYGVEVEE